MLLLLKACLLVFKRITLPFSHDFIALSQSHCFFYVRKDYEIVFGIERKGGRVISHRSRLLSCIKACSAISEHNAACTKFVQEVTALSNLHEHFLTAIN